MRRREERKAGSNSRLDLDSSRSSSRVEANAILPTNLEAARGQLSVSEHGRTRGRLLESAQHRFSVGQFVRLTNRIGVWPKTDEVYRITGTLPARDNSLQYRIRNDDERHERVATEDNLELVEAPPSTDGATLNSWTEGSATMAKRQIRNPR